MPNPRKAVSQLSELNRKRNSGRYKSRQNAPKPGEFDSKAPEHLTKDQQSIWNEVVALMPPGVLRAPDVLICELTVRLLEKMRAGTLKVAEVGQLRSCLASLGASPADRSRVEVPATEEKSLLELILEGKDECGHKKLN